MSDQPEASENITRKAGRGLVWNFLTYGIGKGGVLISTSILARLLSQNDFGLVSVAIIAINYLSFIRDLGLSVALIQRRDNVERAADTVFSLNLILGFFLAAITYPLAPFVAEYFNEPMVIPVLRWLGLTFVINAFGSVHVVWLMRELDYRRKFIPDMGNTLVKVIVSIGFALSGAGVWALVFGQLLGSLTSVILLWVVNPWRPRFIIHTDMIGSLMKFGSSIVTGDILSVFIENIGYIIVGRMFGVAQVSIYTLALRLPEILLIGNLWVMSGVIFPAFSSIQHKPDEMRRGTLMSIRLIQILAVPIAFGLFLAADPIVRVVFGEQWLDVIPLLRGFAIYAWIYSIGYQVGDIYKAIGRPILIVWLDVLTLLVIVPALLIGSTYGLVGIVGGHVFTVFVRRFVGFIMAARFVKITMFDISRELTPSLAGGVVMVAVVLIVMAFVEGMNPFIQLSLIVLAGAVTYGAILWRLERDNMMRLVKIVVNRK